MHVTHISYFSAVDDNGQGKMSSLKGSIDLYRTTVAHCNGCILVIVNPDRTWRLEKRVTAESAKGEVQKWADAINARCAQIVSTGSTLMLKQKGQKQVQSLMQKYCRGTVVGFNGGVYKTDTGPKLNQMQVYLRDPRGITTSQYVHGFKLHCTTVLLAHFLDPWWCEQDLAEIVEWAVQTCK